MNGWHMPPRRSNTAGPGPCFSITSASGPSSDRDERSATSNARFRRRPRISLERSSRTPTTSSSSASASKPGSARSRRPWSTTSPSSWSSSESDSRTSGVRCPSRSAGGLLHRPALQSPQAALLRRHRAQGREVPARAPGAAQLLSGGGRWGDGASRRCPDDRDPAVPEPKPGCRGVLAARFNTAAWSSRVSVAGQPAECRATPAGAERS